MLFHKIVGQLGQLPSQPGAKRATPLDLAVSPGSGSPAPSPQASVKPGAMIWALAMIVLFVVATFGAHQWAFPAGETVFLNLTVVLTSASVGAFLGEHMAVEKLLK